MHNSTIYVFFLLLSSNMFGQCYHLQGAYTKISSKQTAINTLQQTYIFSHVNNAGFG